MSAFAFRPVAERQIYLPLGKWRLPLWKRQDPLVEFRDMCREMEECPIILPPDVVMIGANYDRNLPKLYQRDKLWLKYALGRCKALGLRVRPDFNLFAPNLKHNEDGLKPNSGIKGGILIVAFVLDPSTNLAKTGFALGALNQEEQVSPYHSPEAWRQLEINSGAKVIVTIRQHLENGETGEISAKYFEGPEYFSLPPQSLWFSGINGADIFSTDLDRSEYIAETLVHRDVAAGLRLDRKSSLAVLSA